jgi:hypothetical protein
MAAADLLHREGARHASLLEFLLQVFVYSIAIFFN